MSVRFKNINKSKLRGDAHFQFHSEFKALFEVKLAGETALAPQFAEYAAAYDSEDIALKQIRKSHLTGRIQTADKARGDAFLGMAEQNRSLLRHYDAAKRNAAERLQVVFGTYGNVSRKSLSEETSAVYNLLQDLRGAKYGADAALAGLADWANELETRNKALEALIRERDSEMGGKPGIKLRAARLRLDEAYRDIAERCEAYALVGASPAPYVSLIESFNVVIERYIKLLNAGGRRGKGAETVVA